MRMMCCREWDLDYLYKLCYNYQCKLLIGWAFWIQAQFRLLQRIADALHLVEAQEIKVFSFSFLCHIMVIDLDEKE